jgi:HSP20 family molecular chaperone IbpA
MHPVRFGSIDGGGRMERFPKIFTVRCRPGEEGQEACYDPFGSHRFAGKTGWTPHTDILETEDDVVIVMDLAGVGKEDFRVTYEENLLKVSGMRTKRQPPGLIRLHRMEIEYGPFEKLFRVPGDLGCGADPGRAQKRFVGIDPSQEEGPGADPHHDCARGFPLKRRGVPWAGISR